MASLDIRGSGKISYNILKNYDVLIITAFDESYSSAEAEAIKQFVENGGGLLLLGSYDSANNSVSRILDVLYEAETVVIADKKAKKFGETHQFYISDISSHPVTKGVEQVALNFALPIVSYKSGEVLMRTSADSWADGYASEGWDSKQSDEDSGPFDILVVLDNVGKGRAVFFACAYSFCNWVIEEKDHQNLELLENAVKWLGQPGGPYKQYKTVNEEAQQTFSEAVSLYENYQFSQAKEKFSEAIGVFEESLGIYPNAEASKGIEDANGYIGKCETGMEADKVFGDAKDLYDKREYEKAIEEYEKAKSLYEEIGYTERVQECSAKIDESNNWIALREEAKSLFGKGEDALATAPSTFNPKGFEDAKSIFEQAKSKWEEYDDPAQVAACVEKIDYCDDEIAKIKKTRMLVIVGSAVIVVVIGGVVVVIFRRKPSPRAAPQPPDTAVYEEEKDALEALRDRYARGEITKEEFEKLKSVLEK